MSTCLDCLGNTSITPCGTTGCSSTNYGKCITYSGADLFCATGAVKSFNVTGVAVSPAVLTEYTVSPTGGAGSSLSVKVTRTPGSTSYTVTLVSAGSGYALNDVVTVAGASLGGSTPANNLSLVITALVPLISSVNTLDEVIANINARLCTLTSVGLNYSGFNYACLRVGGNLDSVGTSITTAQQFAESASAALCSLNTRTLALETPAFTAACVTGITSGTSTLSQILTAYGTKLCSINTQLDLTGVTPLCFTTAPSTSADLQTWFDWVVSNVCSIKTTTDANVTAVTTNANNLKTYISGGSAVPASIDTSCISGGSSTSTLSAAAILFTSQICAINSALASVPTANYSLTWATNFGSTPYYGYTFNYTNTSTTLQIQLDRIVATLGRMKMKLNPAHFTATSDSDGLNVSLVSAGGGATPTFVNLTAGTLTNAVVVSSARFPIGSLPKLQKYGNIVTIIGSLAVNATGSFTWIHGQSLTIANIPAGYLPFYTQVFNVLILKYATTSGTPSTVVYQGVCYLNGTDLVVELNNPAASLTLSGTESLEIFVGGNSYAV
jgi:hypothetical protein